MSSKKSGGITAQHKGLAGKRLGIKIWGGQEVNPGQIIVRQVGTKIKAGSGVSLGRDFTIYAKKKGKINFQKRQGRKIVSVI